MQTKTYLWLLAMLWQCNMLIATPDTSTQDATNGINPQNYANLQSELADAQLYLSEQKAEITALEQKVTTANQENAYLKEKSETILLFGVLFEKAIFVKILFVALWILLVSTVVMSFRARFAIQESVRARSSLSDLEQEYDEHIRKALEREQKLRRQLQDEINRQKISKAS